MADKITVDLHPFFRSDRDIDQAVRTVIFRAARERIPMAEIIVGKGKATLQNRVVKMLGAAHLKRLYRSVEVDPNNDGRVLVHF
ncbi:Smr/MutS family protein [Saccharopolyspora shandongensis]|uniref:Smr/MutS family protein n=1 Tax=Saccharopolyspora shandongensis TaxID=418495 RepID=UPI0033C96555